jgi:hypothetical protein
MGEVLVPLIGFVAVIGAVTASIIVIRIATALIKRLEAAQPGVAPPDPAVGELREELDAMQERLDFLERTLLAQQSQSGRAVSPGERQP